MAYIPLRATELSDIARNNEVNVESLNSFPDAVADVVTFQNNVTYNITKPLNTGILQFKIPDGGQVKIISSSEFVNNWTTELTGSTPLFIGDIGRVVLQDIDFLSVNDAEFIDFTATLVPRPAVIHQRSLVLGFSSIGTIDGAFSIATNAAFVNCGAGINLIDNGTNFGTGILWDNCNFVLQSGNHITITGNSEFISFDGLAASPLTGDAVFDLTGAVTTGSAIFTKILFNDVGGGTLGLDVTYSADQVLENIFEIINVDTTSNVVQITLPDATSSGINDKTKRYITDLGNAETNNITVIPNPADGTIIANKPSFVMDKDNQIVEFELIDGQWLIISNSNEYVAFGSMGYTDNATDTVISMVDTYVDIAGAIVAGDLERFTFSGGVLTYTGPRTEEFQLSVNFSLKKALGASARQVRAALFIDSGSGFVEQGSAPMDMDNNIKSFGFTSLKELNTNDKLKIQIKNETNDDDILIVTYNFVGTTL